VHSFLILTTGDLPEAYFLAAFLESMMAPFALVNIVARPRRDALRVLVRLARRRGPVYLGDLLLGRATARLRRIAGRSGDGVGAFPEVDATLIAGIRARHPHLDCRDPHAAPVLAFVRAQAPDYILLAGAPVLRREFFGLARRGALNRHLGLLPDFRGSDCALWAFALGRVASSGYSIHVVNERVDGGAVVDRQPVLVRDEQTLEQYLRRLRREGSDAFVRVLGTVLDGGTLGAVDQGPLGPHFPPAGWSVRRRAARNFARLVGDGRAPDDPLPAEPDRPLGILPG
jgi:folate-dependent phosphoribosylglycinamide formyltransferase PurN